MKCTKLFNVLLFFVVLVVTALGQTASAYTDEILSFPFPDSITTDGTVSIPCQWTTSTDRKVVLKIWNYNWTKLEGSSQIIVPAGSYSQNITAEVSGMTDGDLCHMYLMIEEIDSTTFVDRVYQFSIPAVTPQVYTDEILSFPFPTSITTGGTVSIPCQWTTSTDRRIVFKIWNYNWTKLEGSSQIIVPAGSYSQNITAEVSGMTDGDLCHLYLTIEEMSSPTFVDRVYQFSVPAVSSGAPVILSSLTATERKAKIDEIITFRENQIRDRFVEHAQTYEPNRGTVYYYNLNASVNGDGLSPQTPRNRLLLNPYTPTVTPGDTHLFLEGVEHDLAVHTNGSIDIPNSGPGVQGPLLGTYDALTGQRVLAPARRATLTSSSHYRIIQPTGWLDNENLPDDVCISGLNFRMQTVTRVTGGSFNEYDYGRAIFLNAENTLIEHCQIIDDIPTVTDPALKINFSLIMGIELYGRNSIVRNCKLVMKDGDCLYLGGVTNRPRAYSINPQIYGNELIITGPVRNLRTGGDCLQITNTKLMDGGLIFENIMHNSINAKGVLIIEPTDPVDPQNPNPIWVSDNLLIGCDPGSTPYFFAPTPEGDWINGTVPMPQKALSIGKYVNAIGNMIIDAQYGLHAFEGHNDVIGNVFIMRDGQVVPGSTESFRAAINTYYGNMRMIGNTFIGEFDQGSGTTYAIMDQTWQTNETIGNLATGNFSIGFHVNGPMSFTRNNAYGLPVAYQVYDGSGIPGSGTPQSMPAGNSISDPQITTKLYPSSSLGLPLEPAAFDFDMFGNTHSGAQGAIQAQIPD